ncbi:MAG: HD domain-containing protein [Nanoarchaeota archaeon]|nr:HD domain-containing protein [Nanoarchaeota archaeon]
MAEFNDFNILIEKAKSYFENGSGGHGFDHVNRVFNNSIIISEGEDVDLDIVKASALLHDIARLKEDLKEVKCHAEEGAKMAREILQEFDFPENKIEKVIHAIKVHRYSKGLKAESREAEILQDADRLDALGASAIARIMSRAGKKGIPIYDAEISPKDFYDGEGTTAINHFHEKILKIKPGTFKTKKARELAKERYDFVKEFVDRFLEESK